MSIVNLALGRRSVESTQESRLLRDVIYPSPDEEGVFIVERSNGKTSSIRQGTARIGGAVVKYTWERPAEIIDPVPLVVAPGWGGIKPAYREFRNAVVDRGKSAITLKPPHHQERFAGLHPKHLRHPERLLTQAVLAVSQDIINIGGEKGGYSQVDAAGHSMGGPAVTNAALVNHSLFHSITLMGSAGLDGHTLLDLGWRTPRALSQEIVPTIVDMQLWKSARAARHVIEYVAGNPLRTITEGLAVGSGDIRDKVSLARSMGVWTVAQQYANDRLFPLEGVRENSEDRFDLFHVFPDAEAGHLAPQRQPEAVAEDLINSLAALEALKSMAA